MRCCFGWLIFPQENATGQRTCGPTDSTCPEAPATSCCAGSCLAKNKVGSSGCPAMRTSKCRCGPVDLPLEPTRASNWPFSTRRSEEHTSELQSLMRISYAVFCLKKKTKDKTPIHKKLNLVYINNKYLEQKIETTYKINH